MPKFLVEALSQYRMVYVVDTEKKEWAEDTVHMQEAGEFGQMYLGEMVVSSREIDDDEVIRVHDELNEYLVHWTREQKLARVHKVED
jgi:hypothetical protein